MLYEDIADSVAPAKDALYSSHAKRAHCQTNDHKSHRHLQGEPAKDSEGSQLLKTKDERRKFYDKIAPCYDLLAERSEQPIRETAFDMLSPAPGERILEIGCGTGHLLSRVAESVGEEGPVDGRDQGAAHPLDPADLLEHCEELISVEFTAHVSAPNPHDRVPDHLGLEAGGDREHR